MPRIDAVRVGPFWLPLWAAFTVNDFGEYADARLGLSRNHARVRSMRAHERRYPL